MGKKATFYHCRETKAAGAWISQSYLTHHQEQREKDCMLARFFYSYTVWDPHPGNGANTFRLDLLTDRLIAQTNVDELPHRDSLPR